MQLKNKSKKCWLRGTKQPVQKALQEWGCQSRSGRTQREFPHSVLISSHLYLADSCLAPVHRENETWWWQYTIQLAAAVQHPTEILWLVHLYKATVPTSALSSHIKLSHDIAYLIRCDSVLVSRQYNVANFKWENSISATSLSICSLDSVIY